MNYKHFPSEAIHMFNAGQMSLNGLLALESSLCSDRHEK